VSDINTGGSSASGAAFPYTSSRRSFPRPAYSVASSELRTFSDLVVQILDSRALDSGTGLHVRRAMRACMDAYREMAGLHAWNYLKRQTQIATAASQSTGTIVYDHTGGTFERQVTLTGATWPDDARFYKLFIAGNHYAVSEKISSTVITLSARSNPGADVASTTYELARSVYLLPYDFTRLGGDPVHLQSLGYSPEYMGHGELLEYQNFMTPTGRPLKYTIRNSDEEYGGMVLDFAPCPNLSQIYDISYSVQPRPIRPFGISPEYKTGTITVSGTEVTGVGTTFSQRMVGSVIRFTTEASAPSGDIGNDDSYFPYEEQGIVVSVESATVLNIDSALTGTYTAKPFTIGDPLDIETHSMFGLLLYLAEMHYGGTIEGVSAAKEGIKRERLKAAIISDVRQPPLDGWGGGAYGGPMTLEALDNS
jgi:hypothetical protein